MVITCTYRRIIFVVLFVCVSICCYGIINIINKNEKTVTTNALPITNKTIVIDAGHGKPDEGAVRI